MKLFIGCSSSKEIPAKYFDDCQVLLEELLPGNELVFGACNAGLMGLSYSIALQNKSSITGICPEAYQDDFKNLECTTEITTKSVNERTDNLISESDALVFLPGGIGTIYELYTAIESKRCHEFDKPIVIFNPNGFFDPLLSFMDKLYQEGFSKEKDKGNYLVSTLPEEIKYYITHYERIKELEKKHDFSYQSFKEMYETMYSDSPMVETALNMFTGEKQVYQKTKKDDNK